MRPDARTPAERRAAAPWSATIDTRLPSAMGTRPEALRDDQASDTRPRDGRAADDRAIVQRVIDGDRDAFRILVEREAASVIRACQRILGDLHEAEDVAQEAFVIAYRSLGAWRGEGRRAVNRSQQRTNSICHPEVVA